MAAEDERRRRAELDRLEARAASCGATSRCGAASLDERQRDARGRAARRARSRARDALPDALTASRTLRLERPRAADATTRARRAELDRLRSQAAAAAPATSTCAARRSRNGARCSAQRLDRVEGRLAARPDEEAEARARRAELERRRRVVDEIADRLAARSARSSARRAAAPAPAGAVRSRARSGPPARRAARGARRAPRTQLTELRERVEPARDRRGRDPAAARAGGRDDPPRVRLRARRRDRRAGARGRPKASRSPARARELERELRLMGPINPLALSEYEALLERHEFLQKQLDDVKNTRRELHARDQVGRRGDRARVRVGVRRRRRATSPSCSRCCSRAVRAGSCSPSPTTC